MGEKAADKATLSSLVDLALGMPDSGSINLKMLNTVLHTIITKLNLENVEVDAQAPASVDTPVTAKDHDTTEVDEDAEEAEGGEETEAPSKCEVVSFPQLIERVRELEQLWCQLNLIPTNSELFVRLKKMRDVVEDPMEERGSATTVLDTRPCKMMKTGQPVYDTWQNMQIVKQIETNTDGITKLMSLMEDLFREVDKMIAMKDMLLSKFESNNNSAELIDKQLAEFTSFLKSLEDRLFDLEREMAMLPDDDYFDSLPTWAKLEQYFRGIQDIMLAVEEAASRATSNVDAEHESRSVSGSSVSRSSSMLSDVGSEFVTKGKRHRGQKVGSRAAKAELARQASNFSPNENVSITVMSSQHTGGSKHDANHSQSKDFNESHGRTDENKSPEDDASQRRSKGSSDGRGSKGSTSTDEDRSNDASAKKPVDPDEGYAPPPDGTAGTRRRSLHAPEPPATSALKTIMSTLGTLDDRHEALVRRVDALELWIRAQLDLKANSDSSALRDIENIIKDFNSIRDEMACIRAMFNKEAGSIVCAQEKMKQLQADVDCMLKACYGDDNGSGEREDRSGGAGNGVSRCGPESRKPNCNSLQVRMSWCLIVDKVHGLEHDVNQVFIRLGGRMTDDEANSFEGFVTMTNVKNTLKPIIMQVDDKVPYHLLATISMGLGDTVSEMLGKLLDNDNEWRRIIGFLTGIVDSKLARDEMEEFSRAMDIKLRCFSRRLTAFQRKLDGDSSDPAAGTKKARCLSCDRVVRYEREPGEVSQHQVIPPGLPATKCLQVFTTYELEQFRQVSCSIPSAMRPNDACDPFAIHRRTGGVLNKKKAGKRFEPTAACQERDGMPGVKNVSCYMPMDIENAVNSVQVNLKSGRGRSKPEKSPESPAQGAEPSTIDKDPKKKLAANTLAANSPCMVKSDLREFVLKKRKIVAITLAENPNQDPEAGPRKPYKWPTKSLGQQVSGSLTKVTASEDVLGRRTCGKD